MSDTTEAFGNSAVMLTRKKPVSWSFTRDMRFKDRKKSIDVGYVLMPSTLSPRSTIMGFGTRWTPQNPKGKDSPPPGSYTIPSTLEKKGPKFYKQSSLPPITTLSKFSTPGPGSYEHPSPIGREAPKFTFHGSEIKQKVPESPAPGCYSPKTTVTEFSGFKEISFGIGERKVFNNKANEGSPGPGSYNFGSLFDKFRKHRLG